MAVYGENTKVAVEKSVQEISAMIRKRQGSQVAHMDADDRYIVAFALDGRQVKFTVVFADRDSAQFNRRGGALGRDAAYEQHRRQRMRALLLVIKAKFESVESQVETFEEAFFANVVTQNGKTVYERIREDLQIEYDTGSVRPLMLGHG